MMTRVQKRVRERRRERVEIGPRRGQTEAEIEQEFARCFALADHLRERGVESWNSHYRWWGPLKFMAYKEVGPPPWRFPKVGIRYRGKHIRFIVGWRSTAFALNVMWAGEWR